MIKAHLIEDEALFPALAVRSYELARKARTTLSFHQADFPLTWWKHFQGKDGTEFGSRRGRNFLGVKSYLEKALLAVVERDGELVGFAPLVVIRAERRGGKPPLRILSFCADSVIVFYQDLLILPEVRDEAVASLLRLLAAHAEAHDLLVFLGYIPEDSGNLPALAAEAGRLKAEGWSGGLAYSRARPGVYPWAIKPLGKALHALAGVLGEGHAGHAALLDLAARLEAQTSALLVFGATRNAFAEELRKVVEAYRDFPGAAEAVEGIGHALDQGPIIYPYLPLPATKDAYLASMSSSKAYYFRRYMKKYVEAGGTFEELAPEKITEADVEEYLTLHAERWREESVSVNDGTLAFHRELSMRMARAGVFRLFFATVNGRRLAAHACFDVGGRREYFFSGRSPEAETLRAGKLMVFHTVVDAVEKGFATYDFGYGGDEYKADFTKIHRRVKSLFLARKPELLDLEGLFTKYEQMVLEQA